MDRLSPELRAAEAEIDASYKSNPLMGVSFATAAWNVLAVMEDLLLFPLLRENEASRYDLEPRVDRYIFIIKHLFRWLQASCPPKGEVQTAYNEEYYQAALDLIELSSHYDEFCMAFTYASRGLISLRIEDDELVPVSDFTKESRYEAYNRLAKPVSRTPPQETTVTKIQDLHSRISRSVRIQGEQR